MNEKSGGVILGKMYETKKMENIRILNDQLLCYENSTRTLLL